MDELHRQYHEVAELFPLMTGDEFDALKTDIAANGLLEPIWLHPDGRIIDGRNRHRACVELGIEPQFRTWDGGGSLVSFVVSLNLHRRHLNPGQFGIISLKVKPLIAAEIAECKREKGRAAIERRWYGPEANGIGLNQLIQTYPVESEPARDALAETAQLMGVSKATVIRAQAVQRHAPDLADKVAAGEMSLNAAYREVQHTQKRESPPLPPGKYAVIYADPPWSYDNSGFHQSAASHYPTMTTDAICDLPIRDMAGEPCVLYLWATSPLLPDAMRVMAAWGFEYKAHRIWVKDRAPGMGWWIQTYHELLLIGTRGGNAHPTERLPSVVTAPVGVHSRKPEAFRQDISDCHNGPRVELFARQKHEGWDVWGNEPEVADVE